MTLTPCLEVGGTHVSAALVDVDAGTVVRQRRSGLDADAPPAVLLDALADAARNLDADPAARWGVAMPGPFDYPAGIGRFARVGKFDALNGVDVGAGLADRLATPDTAPTFAFLNDAAAFGVGEWWAGAARGTRRAAAVTLGTGTGGCFLADGVPVTSGAEVPPEGVLHLLRYEGRDLEDQVSRRGLIAAYTAATGRTLDVHAIADAARSGDDAAAGAFAAYYRILGEVLDPWLRRFGAEVCVIGGSIARSWDLLEASLRLSVPVRPAEHPEDAPLLGAARHAAAC